MPCHLQRSLNNMSVSCHTMTWCIPTRSLRDGDTLNLPRTSCSKALIIKIICMSHMIWRVPTRPLRDGDTLNKSCISYSEALIIKCHMCTSCHTWRIPTRPLRDGDTLNWSRISCSEALIIKYLGVRSLGANSPANDSASSGAAT